jgi:uridine kinase
MGKQERSDMERRPLTVAITGGTSAGKTTLARALVAEIADLRPVLLNQDAYFRDWSHLPPEEREARITANHPDAVLWDALVADVRALRERRSIEQPVPGTRSAARGDAPRQVEPGDVILVEGHLLLCHEELRALMDLKLFIDVPVEERLLRRIHRDVTEREGDLTWVLGWLRRDVLPNHPIHTEPTRHLADLVIPYATYNPLALRLILAGIRALASSDR